MAFTVFFAWQADRPAKLNRNFIEKAIKTAIKQLRKEQSQTADDELMIDPAPKVDQDEPDEPDLDDADKDIEYQWGARGQTGAGLIGETIFQRIRDCGAFIADLSFTTQVTTADDRTKKVPNANVLIEVGLASGTAYNWHKMILVLNTAYGSVEELPFDLKYRNCQVVYKLADPNDPEKATKAKELANDFARQLRPMYQTALKKAAEERRNAEEAARLAVEARKEAAQAEREAWEGKLLAGTYRKVKAKRGIVAVSVIPAKPKAIKPLTDHYQFQHKLAPINCESGVVQREMKSEICYWESSGKVNAITELATGTGSIHMMRNLLWHFGEEEKTVPFDFQEYQSAITKYVQRYLNTLKEQGVDGPWFVGLSFLFVRGFEMIIGHWPIANAAVGEDDPEHVQTDLVMIPADADTSKAEVVANLLKPAYVQVWRAFHTNAPA